MSKCLVSLPWDVIMDNQGHLGNRSLQRIRGIWEMDHCSASGASGKWIIAAGVFSWQRRAGHRDSQRRRQLAVDATRAAATERHDHLAHEAAERREERHVSRVSRLRNVAEGRAAAVDGVRRHGDVRKAKRPCELRVQRPAALLGAQPVQLCQVRRRRQPEDLCHEAWQLVALARVPEHTLGAART